MPKRGKKKESKAELSSVEAVQKKIFDDLKDRVLAKLKPEISANEEAIAAVTRIKASWETSSNRVQELERNIIRLTQARVKAISRGEDFSELNGQLAEAETELRVARNTAERIKNRIPQAEEEVKIKNQSLLTTFKEILEPVMQEYQKKGDALLDEALMFLEGWQTAISILRTNLGISGYPSWLGPICRGHRIRGYFLDRRE